MMRLAEMYLIYAEAVLGNNASTNDPTRFNIITQFIQGPVLSPLADGTGAPALSH